MKLTMDILGGKWKLLILWQLSQGTKRYGEIRSALEEITHKMLTQQLRELEQDGIVRRKIFKVVPPKVEYSLTEDGERLTSVMNVMADWANAFRVDEEQKKGLNSKREKGTKKDKMKIAKLQEKATENKKAGKQKKSDIKASDKAPIQVSQGERAAKNITAAHRMTKKKR